MSFLSTIGAGLSSILSPITNLVTPITGFFTRRSEMQTVQHVVAAAAPVAQQGLRVANNAVDVAGDLGARSINVVHHGLVTGQILGTRTLATAAGLGAQGLNTVQALGGQGIQTAGDVTHHVLDAGQNLGTQAFTTTGNLGHHVLDATQALGSQGIATVGNVAHHGFDTTRALGTQGIATVGAVADHGLNTVQALGTQVTATAGQGIHRVADSLDNVTNTLGHTANHVADRVLSMPQQLVNTADHEIRSTGPVVRRMFSHLMDDALAAAQTAHRGAVAVGSVAMGTFLHVLTVSCNPENSLTSVTCHTFSYGATVCTGLAVAAVAAIVVNTFRAPNVRREYATTHSSSESPSASSSSSSTAVLPSADEVAETYAYQTLRRRILPPGVTPTRDVHETPLPPVIRQLYVPVPSAPPLEEENQEELVPAPAAIPAEVVAAPVQANPAPEDRMPEVVAPVPAHAIVDAPQMDQLAAPNVIAVNAMPVLPMQAEIANDEFEIEADISDDMWEEQDRQMAEALARMKSWR